MRSELHHLRRVTVERQLIIAQEKKALIDELESFKAQDSDQRREATEALKRQLGVLQDLVDEKEKSCSEIKARFDAEACDLQSRSTDLGNQHKAELETLQRGLGILRQMEAAREEQMRKERESTGRILEELRKSAHQSTTINLAEKKELEAEVHILRSANDRLLADMKSAASVSESRRRSVMRRLDEQTHHIAAPADPSKVLSIVEQMRREDVEAQGKLQRENEDLREKLLSMKQKVIKKAVASGRAARAKAQTRTHTHHPRYTLSPGRAQTRGTDSGVPFKSPPRSPANVHVSSDGRVVVRRSPNW